MTKGKSFFQLASALPIVSDTVSYVRESYNGIKTKNRLVGAFMNGVERSVFRATYAAFYISKVAVPYDYLDNVASEELKKAEEKYPLIKKPTKQVWKECSTYALSKISGVTAKKKIPDNLSDAVKTRVTSVVKNVLNYTTEIKPIKFISHKILDKTEEFIEKIMPDKKHKAKPRTKPDLVMERISETLSRIKAKMNEIAKEIAELKGEHKKTKEPTIQEMIEVSEHLLSKFYNELRAIHQYEDKIFGRISHFIKVVTTGTILNILGGIKETLPELEKLIAYLKEKTQKSITWVKENGENLASESYKETRAFLKHCFIMVKKINPFKIFVSIKRALEVFWKEITNEEFTFNFSISESLAISARAGTEDTDKMETEYSNELKFPSVSSSEFDLDPELFPEAFNTSFKESLQSSDQIPSPKNLDRSQSNTTITNESTDKDSSPLFWRRFRF